MRLVLGAGFASILERHLEAASPGDLMLWALAALPAADPALSVRRSGREVQLLAGDRVLLARPLPERARGEPVTAAGGAAADRLTLFQEAAWAVSAPLRRAGASRLIRDSFDSVFGHLDPFSRYITPEEAQAARERRTGEAGLGLRLAPAGGRAPSSPRSRPAGPPPRPGC